MNPVFLFPLALCALTWAAQDGPYFPVSTKPADGITAFEAESYGKSLQRMNEPRLPALATDVSAEVYRVMILPTWGNSIVVRVQKHGKTYSLSARRLDGQAGYDPGKLVGSKDLDLGNSDSDALDLLLQNVRLSEMPTRDEVRGFDGDEWVLEGVSHGNYHVVTRWCATSYDPKKRSLANFLALFRFLLDKSALSRRPTNKGDKLM